jgi:signal transduction histidine kinase
LAIARGFVEAHGGEIRAESPPGEGCTVSFTLPRRPATES